MRRLLELALRLPAPSREGGDSFVGLAFLGLACSLPPTPYCLYEYPVARLLTVGVRGGDGRSDRSNRSDDRSEVRSPGSAGGAASAQPATAAAPPLSALPAALLSLISPISVPGVGGNLTALGVHLGVRRVEEMRRDRELQLESARLIKGRGWGRGRGRSLGSGV